MPLCHNARANRCCTLKGMAAWGYCAAKDEHYYGLRGHLLLGLNTVIGVIGGFGVTPANVDERQALWDMVETIEGLLIGDKGYLGEQCSRCANWLRPH